MSIKKGLLFTFICAMLALPMMAEEAKGGHQKADITYQTAPIYKVLDSKDFYVVLYGKYGAKIGTVTIPKKWATWQKDTPRKLSLRQLPSKMGAFMTLVKKDNEFHKVILTVPLDHTNRLWGIINDTKVDKSEKDSIELELR